MVADITPGYSWAINTPWLRGLLASLSLNSSADKKNDDLVQDGDVQILLHNFMALAAAGSGPRHMDLNTHTTLPKHLQTASA